jgi:hypothetical protein
VKWSGERKEFAELVDGLRAFNHIEQFEVFAREMRLTEALAIVCIGNAAELVSSQTERWISGRDGKVLDLPTRGGIPVAPGSPPLHPERADRRDAAGPGSDNRESVPSSGRNDGGPSSASASSNRPRNTPGGLLNLSNPPESVGSSDGIITQIEGLRNEASPQFEGTQFEGPQIEYSEGGEGQASTQIECSKGKLWEQVLAGTEEKRSAPQRPEVLAGEALNLSALKLRHYVKDVQRLNVCTNVKTLNVLNVKTRAREERSQRPSGLDANWERELMGRWLVLVGQKQADYWAAAFRSHGIWVDAGRAERAIADVEFRVKEGRESFRNVGAAIWKAFQDFAPKEAK